VRVHLRGQSTRGTWTNTVQVTENKDTQFWACNMRTGGVNSKRIGADNEQLRTKGSEKSRRDKRLAVA
jgi:hypothetical protein